MVYLAYCFVLLFWLVRFAFVLLFGFVVCIVFLDGGGCLC